MGKKYFWLTSDYQGDMSTLKMDPQKDKPEQEFLEQHNIWFNEDEKEKAFEFLYNLKCFIYNEYVSKYPERAKWCTEKWLEKQHHETTNKCLKHNYYDKDLDK